MKMKQKSNQGISTNISQNESLAIKSKKDETWVVYKALSGFSTTWANDSIKFSFNEEKIKSLASRKPLANPSQNSDILQKYLIQKKQKAMDKPSLQIDTDESQHNPKIEITYKYQENRP